MTLNQSNLIKRFNKSAADKLRFPYRKTDAFTIHKLLGYDWHDKSIYGQSTKRKTNWLKIIIEYIIVSTIVAFVFGYLAHIRINSITEASNVSSNNVNWQTYIDAHRTR